MNILEAFTQITQAQAAVVVAVQKAGITRAHVNRVRENQHEHPPETMMHAAQGARTAEAEANAALQKWIDKAAEVAAAFPNQ